MQWFSTEALAGDETDERLTLAFMLSGAYAKGGLAEDDDIFVAFNMHWEDQIFKLPALPKGESVVCVCQHRRRAPDDIHELGKERKLSAQKTAEAARSLGRGAGRALAVDALRATVEAGVLDGEADQMPQLDRRARGRRRSSVRPPCSSCRVSAPKTPSKFLSGTREARFVLKLAQHIQVLLVDGGCLQHRVADLRQQLRLRRC